MCPVGDDLGGDALKILIAGDVFPPHCGGAGWSAYYLARALRARGHTIAVVRPRFDAATLHPTILRTTYDDLPIAELRLPTAGSPLRRLWTRNVVAPRLLRRLIRSEAHRLGADLIHAQHALTVTAAVGVGHSPTQRHIPVVATVRDYWPLCYYSTMQVPGRGFSVVVRRESGVGTASLTTPTMPQSGVRLTFHVSRFTFPIVHSVSVRGPGLLPLARAVWQGQGRRAWRIWPLLPAWEWATVRRRAALRQAAATVAVSGFVAARLRAGGVVRSERLHVIPNLVDLPRVAEILTAPAPLDQVGLTAGQPFLLFVGKLEVSKGAWLLPAALQAAGVGSEWPVVIAGSGPLQATLAEVAQVAGLDFRFGFWPDGDDVLRLMRAATVLLFPSAWDEPLTRVLLEACAAGATILALATGGTSDILTDDVDGRLVADMDAFARALRALLADPAARARLAAGAQATARARFSADVVGAQVEALYRSLL